MTENKAEIDKTIHELDRRLFHYGYRVKEVFYRKGKPCFLIGEI